MRRRGNFRERFDHCMKMASQCFNELLKVAKQKKRNIILDQTNVYASARRRKIKQFGQWGQVIAACCIPYPEDYYQRQAACAANGKVVPPKVVANFKANFELP